MVNLWLTCVCGFCDYCVFESLCDWVIFYARDFVVKVCLQNFDSFKILIVGCYKFRLKLEEFFWDDRDFLAVCFCEK